MKANRTEQDLAFDTQVGARIRALRTQKGMTQSELGTVAGVTFQQLQKYEQGRNRVAASRLAAIARGLGVPPSLLLGEVEDATTRLSTDEHQLLAVYRTLSKSRKALTRELLQGLAHDKAEE